MSMDPRWIEIAGVEIRAPITAGTNLVLAIQCALYGARLRTGTGDHSRMWSGFFSMMAIATLAGVIKHGFPHELSDTALLGVLWVSNLAGGISIFFAQRASLVFRAPTWDRRRIGGRSRAQLSLFLLANVVLGPQLFLLVANAAVGLLPVIVVEGTEAFRGDRGGAWIAGGLILGIATGGVYTAGLSVGTWLNHIDIAHLLMGVGFWLMVRGCASGPARPQKCPPKWPPVGRLASGRGAS